MKFLRLIAVHCMALFVLAGAASASDISSTVGDRDCFGLGGSCPDGTRWQNQLGGVFFNNYQTPGDPAFTDKWSTDIAPTYVHNYVLDGIPTVADLLIKFAGVADFRGPWDVLFNGSLIGQIPTNTSANGFQEVKSYVYSVPLNLLTGSDTVQLNINVPTQTDGYSIDFSQLEIVTSPVPEPGTILMLGSGLLGVAVLRRRR